jgi:hypothetical protein
MPDRGHSLAIDGWKDIAEKAPGIHPQARAGHVISRMVLHFGALLLSRGVCELPCVLGVPGWLGRA